MANRCHRVARFCHTMASACHHPARVFLRCLGGLAPSGEGPPDTPLERHATFWAVKNGQVAPLSTEVWHLSPERCRGAALQSSGYGESPLRQRVFQHAFGRLKMVRWHLSPERCRGAALQSSDYGGSPLRQRVFQHADAGSQGVGKVVDPFNVERGRSRLRRAA